MLISIKMASFLLNTKACLTLHNPKMHEYSHQFSEIRPVTQQRGSNVSYNSFIHKTLTDTSSSGQSHPFTLSASAGPHTGHVCRQAVSLPSDRPKWHFFQKWTTEEGTGQGQQANEKW